MKREFLLLAQNYNADKHGSCPGWYASEKLDGVRAFWDGGISRGIAASDVPYANVAKHERYIHPPVATGLWTRYGQPIQAPSWWLDVLPKIPLDGELWMGKQAFQRTTSTVRSLTPNHTDWRSVRYMVFDSPPLSEVFGNGSVNNSFFKKTFDTSTLLWASIKGTERKVETLNSETPFYMSLRFLGSNIKPSETLQVHNQHLLPYVGPMAKADIDHHLDAIERNGGEGLMLRSPVSFWKPERSWNLLKVKRLYDMEGTVLGYKWAKPTDLDKSVSGQVTNKLLGLMGAVTLRLDSGVVFDLGSGFTDEERRMKFDGLAGGMTSGESEEIAYQEGTLNPGAEANYRFYNPRYPRGSKITFKYRELSDDGCPKEARHWRKA